MNHSILEEIAEKTRLRVAKANGIVPFDHLQKQAAELTDVLALKEPVNSFSFEKALRTEGAPGLSFICEVKKASPSKGIIAKDFPYLEIAKEYEVAGATAISVLTEPDYFLGSDAYLQEIAQTVQIPTLRKDFIVDPYQIYEAKLLGAKAVLLICALADGNTLAQYIKTADTLGLSSLVEIHNEAEAEQAVGAGARIIGINNRDLKTFTVDFELTSRLRKSIPSGVITVAESGVKSPDDIRSLRDTGVNAVLIGESLMRAADKKKFLAELKAAYDEN